MAVGDLIQPTFYFQKNASFHQHHAKPLANDPWTPLHIRLHQYTGVLLVASLLAAFHWSAPER